MLEQIILGIIQGITEWLPISSEGMIILTKTTFFKDPGSLDTMIQEAIFLHLGSLLAALIYFRKDVALLCQSLLQYKKADPENQKTLIFLVIATFISGTIGIGLLKLLSLFTGLFTSKLKFITLIVGLCLLVTAYLELRSSKSGHRSAKDLTLRDGILLGIAQGFSALPGLSRSGLTVSVLLLSNFDKGAALRLSFLMSIPIILAGNIVLNARNFAFSPELLVGLFFSFILGISTIHGLLKLAQKINFGYFVLFFGLLTIAAAFL
ncbi:MAG: undecaprenyl-diphosphate phosphatase [Candidatus Omnitrophica bacterium]|nr:undecaprenyl-diphosphate phosphatase [Candidatus Omnitrophota bacterium]